jgi:hypothetical protein
MSAAEEKRHWLEPPEWWKKVKPLRWAAVGGLIFVGVSVFWTAKTIIAPSAHPEKGRFTAMVEDPVPMLDGLRSYESVGAASARLDAAKVQYTLAPVRTKPSAKYPPRHRDTLTAAKYVHLGVEGKLTLEFFNDRLYEATFEPSDPDLYAEALHKADTRLKRDRNGRAETVVGHLRVASNVDFANTEVGRNLNTRPYVIWQDRRLVELLDEWDRRFVAIPAKS